jgi:hypothetical protein
MPKRHVNIYAALYIIVHTNWFLALAVLLQKLDVITCPQESIL